MYEKMFHKKSYLLKKTTSYSFQDDKEEQRVSLLQAGRLNLAMCMIKISDWLEARNLCDKV